MNRFSRLAFGVGAMTVMLFASVSADVGAVSSLDAQPGAPVLDIPIPFVNFSGGANDAGILSLPFLSQYIGGIYTFALSVVGLVAAVMLIIGGFQYLTSAGDKSKIADGKKRITDALIGMVLAFGSYILLYTINPALVRFQGLRVNSVETQIFDDSNTGVDFDPSEASETGVGTGKVPLYKQDDKQWRVDTGCGTINMGLSGCGPTSVAMVMGSYGKQVSPLVLEKLFRDKGFKNCGGGTSPGGLYSERTVGAFGFDGGLIKGQTAIETLLREGKPVIVGVHGPSIFTTNGHYIVLTGIDSSGNLSINDPNGPRGEGYDRMLLAKRKEGETKPTFPVCENIAHRFGWEICEGQKISPPIPSSKVPGKYVWSVLSHAQYIYPK